MANLKISQLTNGNPAAVGDQIPINRGGTNFSITAGTIASSSPSISTSQLAAVSPAPVITNGGTPGAATWTYTVVAKDANGGAAPASATGSTATGNATLTGANTNIITWTASTGATSYDVYRTVAATSPTTTGKIGNTTSLTLTDTALAGDSSTAPVTNTTGQIAPAYTSIPVPGLINASTVQLFASNIAFGNVSLYTVPSGKRAIIVACTSNTSVQTLTAVNAEVLISATYYGVAVPTTPTGGGTLANQSNWAGIVLEAGQSFAITSTAPTPLALTAVVSSGGTTTYTGTITGGGSNALAGHTVAVAGFSGGTGTNNGTFGPVLTSSTTNFTVATTTQGTVTAAATWQDQTGLNVFGEIYLFNTSSPLKSSVITSFVNGNNTVYTCPAGKNASIATLYAFSTSGATAAAQGWNLTGGALTYTWNYVTNGNTPVQGNQLGTVTTAATNPVSFSGVSGGWTLTPGDFISVNSTSTGKQLAFVTVYEQ